MGGQGGGGGSNCNDMGVRVLDFHENSMANSLIRGKGLVAS